MGPRDLLAVPIQVAAGLACLLLQAGSALTVRPPQEIARLRRGLARGRPQAAGSRRAAPTSKAAVGQRSGRGRSRAPPGPIHNQANRRCRPAAGGEQHDETARSRAPQHDMVRRARALEPGWPSRRTRRTSPTARPARARRQPGVEQAMVDVARVATDTGWPRTRPAPRTEQPVRERTPSATERKQQRQRRGGLCGSRVTTAREREPQELAAVSPMNTRAAAGSRTGTRRTRRAGWRRMNIT